MKNQVNSDRPYLLASDFDQTLSFNDSGIVLSQLPGRSGFQEKVAGMAQKHLVQQACLASAVGLRSDRGRRTTGAARID